MGGAAFAVPSGLPSADGHLRTIPDPAAAGRRLHVPRGAYLRRAPEELYDLRADPDERINIIGDAAAAPVLADLRERLRRMRVQSHDPWLAGQTDPYAHLKTGH